MILLHWGLCWGLLVSGNYHPRPVQRSTIGCPLIWGAERLRRGRTNYLSDISLGLYGDNRVSWGYIGIMEKKMETTVIQ